MRYDLIIVGGGPAGFDGVREAAALGLKTALVEAADLGGTCLNWGCIPTKLFLGATAAFPELAAQKKLRLADGELRFDLKALQRRKQTQLEATRKAMAGELAASGVELVRGRAKVASLDDPGEIVVENEDGSRTLAFSACLLASGSRPAAFPGMSPDGDAVLDSNGVLALDEVPESLIVVGAGAVGLELGEFFSRLGTKIILVEAMPHPAPTEDPEIGKALASALSRGGWDLHMGAKVASLATLDGQATLTLESGQTLRAAKALFAAGRTPNTAGLVEAGLPLTPRGFIATDPFLRAAGSVFAAGDVNGLTLLAHAASDQARYVARRVAGVESGPYAPGPVPGCIYGTHEVLRVGPTAAALVDQGVAVEVSRAQLAANPMARAHGRAHGFVKAVWSEGRLRGLSAIGHHVTHLAAAASIMVEQQWRREEVKRLIFAHPSLEESLSAALAAPRSPA